MESTCRGIEEAHVQYRRTTTVRQCTHGIRDGCAPDAISLEVITQGATHRGTALESVVADALQLDQALETLQMYSLVRRNRENRTLCIHRLVQAVLRESMTTRERAQWRRQAIHALNAVAYSKAKCDRCRRETGKHVERQVATCFNPLTGKEMVIPYMLPLYCDDCQEDLRVLAEGQTAFVLARKVAALGVGR
jgi:hypothetical protein